MSDRPYIAAGVRTDCQVLLQKFKTFGTVRYDDFAQAWKSMNFAQIYCGRESFAELWEFTEELFHIAKSFWFPPNKLQTRIGGLYLLYCLYYKQLTRDLVKIRITLPEWEEIQVFLEMLKKEKHYDAYYIFCKLLNDSAFHFCLSEREYGLERKVRKYLYQNSPSDKPGDFFKNSFLEQLLEDGILDHLGALHQKYHKLKCDLRGPDETVPEKGLRYSDPTVSLRLKEMINSTMSSCETTRLRALSSTEGETSEDDDIVSIGLRRRQLKDRAFGKHDMETESESEPAARRSPRKKTRSQKTNNTYLMDESENNLSESEGGETGKDMPDLQNLVEIVIKESDHETDVQPDEESDVQPDEESDVQPDEESDVQPDEESDVQSDEESDVQSDKDPDYHPNVNTHQGNGTSQPMIKRKRGRPRKIVTDNNYVSVKKGVGRKKSKQSESDDIPS